ncbi:MAG: TonB-dependent receptor plug domain-containing protein, partial [Longimicrobiales bacterium]
GLQTAETGHDEEVFRRIISVDLEGVPLQEALKEISRQAGVRLSYSNDLVGRRRVTLKQQQISVGEALHRLLDADGLVAIAGPSGHIAIGPGAWREGAAAERDAAAVVGTVTGRVTSAATGQGVEGVSVYMEGTSLGGVSAAGGRYLIRNVPDGQQTVVVEMIGYARASKQITVTNNNTVVADFALEADAVALDELVVTGTVIATRVRELPSPITIIGAREIGRHPITRVDELFRGMVPGAVAFDQGANNYYATVQMRGQNSLNFSFIKTYIDGVEVADPLYISTIDPESIARVEILRGPQASTIYGSEASGGVLQIFTKRGRQTSRPVVSIRTSFGAIETDFTSDDLVLQQNHALSMFGGGPSFSYQVGGTYLAHGEYVPGGDTDNYSVFGALRATQGALTAD